MSLDMKRSDKACLEHENVLVCTLGALGEERRSRPSSKPKLLARRSINARMFVDNNEDADD